MRRSSSLFLGLVLVLSLPVAVHAAPGGNDGGSDVPDGATLRPALTDLDGDGISDDLQVRLRDARPNDLVDVVVTFETPRNTAWAQRQVGPFDVARAFTIVPGFAATMRAAQVQALAASASVFRIDADFEVTSTNDAANRDFGATAARTALEVDGSGVEVCVVDTGVDPNHEQFASKLPIPFYDAVNGRATAYDDQGHGTHVAGTAVGDGTGSANASLYGGVAPGAALSAAKVLSSSGSGTASQVIAGVEWCAGRAGNVVISMSLGSSSGSDGQDSISQAVQNAVNGGTPVVVAAGNSGDAPQTVGSPGAAEGAITVAAVAEWSAPVGSANHSRGVHLAPWSSRGPTLDGRAKPDISAPGMTITSAAYGTTSGYATYSGTSMATPFVSGAVALALDAAPSRSPSELKTLLRDTAHDRGPTGKDHDWGWGLVDVLALVDAASGGSGQTAPFPVATHLSAQSVVDHGVWEHTFEVTQDALNVPIAATVVIDGEYRCDLWLWGLCWSTSWTGADLDARLFDPSGTQVALSECPLGCHSTSIGRQETVTAMPTTAGIYRLEVFPYEGTPNDGHGGSFVVDLSHGPIGGGTEPPPAPETGAISGTVTDASNAAAIGGATVSIGTDLSTTTDGDGKYAFADLSPATYTITASANGYESASGEITVIAGSTVTLNLQLTRETPAPTTGRLEGTINSTTGAPIDGASVSLDLTTLSATTGTDGTYAFEELEPATYTVTASKDGYESASGEITVVADSTVTLNLQLEPEQPAESIQLSAVGYKVRGLQKVDLAWSGSSAAVDVFRNGSKIATDVSVSPWTDHINARGGGSYTYKVCESGATTCSNEAVVTF
jgi:serine protease AprX